MKHVFATASVLVAVLLTPGLAVADDDDRKDRGDKGGLRFEATLDGAQETANVITDTTGKVTVKFNKALSELYVKLRIRKGENITRAHFHCARPGENGSIVFGVFDPGPLDLDDKGAEGTLTNADVVAAPSCLTSIGRSVNNVAALAFAMRDGLIYFNVHSSAFPGGVIRGQMLEVSND